VESVDAYRDRARQEQEERRAEGRLHAAQRTCITCDERAGKKVGMLKVSSLTLLFNSAHGFTQFNILWLDPENAETFPRGLLDALEDDALILARAVARKHAEDDIEARLRAQMRADALQPLDEIEENALLDARAAPKPTTEEDVFDAKAVDEAKDFLTKTVSRPASYCFLLIDRRRRTGFTALAEGSSVFESRVLILLLVWDRIQQPGGSSGKLPG
jgi:hypothetical protein